MTVPVPRARRLRHAAVALFCGLFALAAVALVDREPGGSPGSDPGPIGVSRHPLSGTTPVVGWPTVGVDRSDGLPAPAPSGSPNGTFTVALTASEVRGTDGPLRRYQVAVEDGTGMAVDDFAAAVDQVLGDGRSWIASGRLRFQRVPQAGETDFTIYLATPATSEQMCARGGLRTERYTSCRLPGQVIINLDRWLTAVPDYDAPLPVYQAYVVNHEVGHELGELHEACPGPGRPAPVMQQQTYGLKGCTANSWPYVNGERYGGELVP